MVLASAVVCEPRARAVSGQGCSCIDAPRVQPALAPRETRSNFEWRGVQFEVNHIRKSLVHAIRRLEAFVLLYRGNFLRGLVDFAHASRQMERGDSPCVLELRIDHWFPQQPFYKEPITDPNREGEERVAVPRAVRHDLVQHPRSKPFH